MTTLVDSTADGLGSESATEAHGAGRLDPRVLARKVLFLLLAVTLAVGTGLWVHLLTDLPRESAYMAAIVILAAVLWLTEALPLFATSLLVIGLMVLLLANPMQWPGFGFLDPAASPNYREIIGIMADPIIVLFFGGFMLASAIAKSGLDRQLAGLIVHPFGGSPYKTLAGVMLATALFSMWMSNTAATAMMIGIMLPMLHNAPKGEPFRKAMVLGVAFAANIGGMGTPIGTPPNAIALGFLRKNLGIQVGFLEWMVIAVPLMLGLLALCWAVLALTFRPQTPDLNLTPPKGKMKRTGWFVLVIFLITVVLWLTGQWTGLPSAVVALFPAVAFTVTALLNRDDLNQLEWNVLILIAGGLALGWGLQEVGLADSVVKQLKGDAGFLVMAALRIFLLHPGHWILGAGA